MPIRLVRIGDAIQIWVTGGGIHLSCSNLVFLSTYSNSMSFSSKATVFTVRVQPTPEPGVEIPAFAPCSPETEDQNWDLVLEK
jgi:hypothetical protein